MKLIVKPVRTYYFFYADPKAETPVAQRRVGTDFKPMAVERDRIKKAGNETTPIYKYDQKFVSFEK